MAPFSLKSAYDCTKSFTHEKWLALFFWLFSVRGFEVKKIQHYIHAQLTNCVQVYHWINLITIPCSGFLLKSFIYQKTL